MDCFSSGRRVQVVDENQQDLERIIKEVARMFTA